MGKKLICVAEKGITVSGLYTNWVHSYEYGQVFSTGNWFGQKLLENYGDDFKLWSPVIEAEIKAAQKATRRRATPKAEEAVTEE